MRCHACWHNAVTCVNSTLVHLKSILRANRSPSRQSSTAHARHIDGFCNREKWERATAFKMRCSKTLGVGQRNICDTWQEKVVQKTYTMRGTVAGVPRMRISTHFVDDLLHRLRQECILVFRSMSNALYRWDDGGGITAVGYGLSWF